MIESIPLFTIKNHRYVPFVRLKAMFSS